MKDIGQLLNKSIFFILIISTLFLSSNYFVDKDILPKMYSFIICISSLFLIKMILEYKKRKCRVNLLSFVIIIFAIYIFLRDIYLFDIKSISFVCFIFAFFLFQYITSENNRYYINSIIVFGCVAQSIYGLLQYFQLVYNFTSFPIIGSFDNPAGFAACLSAAIPISFSLININKKFRICIYFSIIIIFISIILSESRAGIISIILVSIITLYNKYINTLSYKRRTLILGMLSVIIIIIALGLFFLKKDSATGRVLIWQTTINMIKNNSILFGMGRDAFYGKYMFYQGLYFEKNPSDHFGMLADNVLHPFNEYLRLIVEYGLIGLALLLVAIVVIVKYNRKKMSPYFLSLLSIMVFSTFSYPFKYSFIWLILAYDLAYLSNRSPVLFSIKKSVCKKVRIISLIGVFACILSLIKNIKFEYRWKDLTRLSSLGRTESLIPEYKKLHTCWNGNPFFLYNYGALLNKIERYEESNEILKECGQYFVDYNQQILLADNYLNIKEWKLAEKTYLTSLNMCPNRFYPLSKLIVIYDSIGNPNMAKKVAEIIVSKPIKIHSSSIDEIKLEAQMRLFEFK